MEKALTSPAGEKPVSLYLSVSQTYSIANSFFSDNEYSYL